MRTSMKIAIYIIGIGLLFVTGCWAPVRETDVVGSFVMKSNWACGNLTLKADHTFQQELSKGCSAARANITGKWKVDLDNASVVTISFTPFLGRNPENDQVQSFGFTDFTVSRLKWGPVRIVIDPDAGTSYDKQ
jgi:hypothetical protein